MAQEQPSFAWRRALEPDDAAILELVLALYEEDPSPEPVPIDHTQRTLRALRAEPVRGMAVVLDDGAGPRGYALLVTYWSNELGGETCEIDELYVTSDLRSRGFASALITSIAEGAPPWGRRPVAMCLQVTPGNARARKLYERHGFAAWKNTMMVRRLR